MPPEQMSQKPTFWKKTGSVPHAAYLQASWVLWLHRLLFFFFLNQNRGVLYKGCLFLSENIKVPHENAHVRARTQAQMEVMEQNSMCALKKMSMKHKQAISIKLKCDTCRTKTPISFVPELCWFHVVTATEAAVWHPKSKLWNANVVTAGFACCHMD